MLDYLKSCDWNDSSFQQQKRNPEDDPRIETRVGV
jgi:hypothetical protein